MVIIILQKKIFCLEIQLIFLSKILAIYEILIIISKFLIIYFSIIDIYLPAYTLIRFGYNEVLKGIKDLLGPYFLPIPANDVVSLFVSFLDSRLTRQHRSQSHGERARGIFLHAGRMSACPSHCYCWAQPCSPPGFQLNTCWLLDTPYQGCPSERQNHFSGQPTIMEHSSKKGIPHGHGAKGAYGLHGEGALFPCWAQPEPKLFQACCRVFKNMEYSFWIFPGIFPAVFLGKKGIPLRRKFSRWRAPCKKSALM